MEKLLRILARTVLYRQFKFPQSPEGIENREGPTDGTILSAKIDWNNDDEVRASIMFVAKDKKKIEKKFKEFLAMMNSEDHPSSTPPPEKKSIWDRYIGPLLTFLTVVLAFLAAVFAL